MNIWNFDHWFYSRRIWTRCRDEFAYTCSLLGRIWIIDVWQSGIPRVNHSVVCNFTGRLRTLCVYNNSLCNLSRLSSLGVEYFPELHKAYPKCCQYSLHARVFQVISCRESAKCLTWHYYYIVLRCTLLPSVIDYEVLWECLHFLLPMQWTHNNFSDNYRLTMNELIPLAKTNSSTLMLAVFSLPCMTMHQKQLTGLT